MEFRDNLLHKKIKNLEKVHIARLKLLPISFLHREKLSENLLIWFQVLRLLRNKQKMVSPTIGFLKRFRLRLSIAKRHSANVELQNEKSEY